ncbi:hypothetical protein [Novosphingobium sp.]|uniref:helix-turn-helix domain-containing protein n=1 Tax=Novosphingobium sp. TaxID=1874826 RepID=UPI002629BB50|nr:hypothetical protein [Novosphingobium sp.]
MILDLMHPEDIKAAIRKRYGTISRFIEERDLPATGVSDLLRGRTSRRVREAVEDVLKAQVSTNLDCSDGPSTAHEKSARRKVAA